MIPLIQPKNAVLVFIVALTCFGLSPMAQALLPPPPPGGAMGQHADFRVLHPADTVFQLNGRTSGVAK
jgi:hypothetical protein